MVLRASCRFETKFHRSLLRSTKEPNQRPRHFVDPTFYKQQQPSIRSSSYPTTRNCGVYIPGLFEKTIPAATLSFQLKSPRETGAQHGHRFYFVGF